MSIVNKAQMLDEIQALSNKYNDLHKQQKEIENLLSEYFKGTTWVRKDNDNSTDSEYVIYFKIDKVEMLSIDDDDIDIRVEGISVDYYLNDPKYEDNVSIEYSSRFESLNALLGKKSNSFSTTSAVSLEEFNKAVAFVKDKLNKFLN